MSKYWLLCHERGQQIWNASLCERKCVNTVKSQQMIQVLSTKHQLTGSRNRNGDTCESCLAHGLRGSLQTLNAAHSRCLFLHAEGHLSQDICHPGQDRTVWYVYLIRTPPHQRAQHSASLTSFAWKLKQTLPLYPSKPLWPPPGFLP